jgi:hypothetical protein
LVSICEPELRVFGLRSVVLSATPAYRFGSLLFYPSEFELNDLSNQH